MCYGNWKKIIKGFNGNDKFIFLRVIYGGVWAQTLFKFLKLLRSTLIRIASRWRK